MKCKLFLPYIDFNDSNFYASNSYYKDGDYEQALMNSYNEKSMEAYKSNTMDDKMAYTTCESELFDEQDNEIDIDKLVSMAVSDDVSLMIVKLDFNTIEEEFESDFKLWYDTHIKINENEIMADDIKFANEPKRTMVLSFINLKGNEMFIELQNCKILENVGNDKFAIIIERMNFVKGI